MYAEIQRQRKGSLRSEGTSVDLKHVAPTHDNSQASLVEARTPWFGGGLAGQEIMIAS